MGGQLQAGLLAPTPKGLLVAWLGFRGRGAAAHRADLFQSGVFSVASSFWVASEQPESVISGQDRKQPPRTGAPPGSKGKGQRAKRRVGLAGLHLSLRLATDQLCDTRKALTECCGPRLHWSHRLRVAGWVHDSGKWHIVCPQRRRLAFRGALPQHIPHPSVPGLWEPCGRRVTCWVQPMSSVVLPSVAFCAPVMGELQGYQNCHLWEHGRSVRPGAAARSDGLSMA